MDQCQSRLSSLKDEHSDAVRLLSSRIASLEAELSELRASIAPPKEPLPDGSKFKMYIDLKSENSKLARQLQKTKEMNEKIVAGGMAARRKASSAQEGGGRGEGGGGAILERDGGGQRQETELRDARGNGKGSEEEIPGGGGDV